MRTRKDDHPNRRKVKKSERSDPERLALTREEDEQKSLDMLGITAKLGFTVATQASWPRISLSGDTTELVQPREDKWY